jgi:predicted  nucleic acid-binding Zn-ribbon protein
LAGADTAQNDAGFERHPNTQAALDVLLERVKALQGLQEQVAKAQQHLEQRAGEPLKLARELQALARGEADAIQPALSEGRAEYARQEETIRSATERISRLRDAVGAVAGALDLAVRDLLADAVNEPALSNRTRQQLAEAQRSFAGLREWLDGRQARWQPAEAVPGAQMSVGQLMELLPELGDEERSGEAT